MFLKLIVKAPSYLDTLNELAYALADDANYASYAGNVVNPLQPNITTVGTLTDLSVSGNIIGGNLVSANFLTGTLTTQTHGRDLGDCGAQGPCPRE
jgi:hypothetical protein